MPKQKRCKWYVGKPGPSSCVECKRCHANGRCNKEANMRMTVGEMQHRERMRTHNRKMAYKAIWDDVLAAVAVVLAGGLGIAILEYCHHTLR